MTITDLDLYAATSRTLPLIAIPQQRRAFIASGQDVGQDDDILAIIDCNEARIWAGHQRVAVNTLLHNILVACSTPTGEAEAQNHGTDGGVLWSEPARLIDGRGCNRLYDFSPAELDDAGDDLSNLPWDGEHIVKVVLRD